MDDFSVKPGRIEFQAVELQCIVKKLQYAGNVVSSVRSGLTWQVKQREQIDSALDKLRTNVIQLASRSNKMSKSLRERAQSYSKTENSIVSFANEKAGNVVIAYASAKVSGNTGTAQASGNALKSDLSSKLVSRIRMIDSFVTHNDGSNCSPYSSRIIPQSILTTVISPQGKPDSF
jgi:hypothetical protein